MRKFLSGSNNFRPLRGNFLIFIQKSTFWKILVKNPNFGSFILFFGPFSDFRTWKSIKLTPNPEKMRPKLWNPKTVILNQNSKHRSWNPVKMDPGFLIQEIEMNQLITETESWISSRLKRTQVRSARAVHWTTAHLRVWEWPTPPHPSIQDSILNGDIPEPKKWVTFLNGKHTQRHWLLTFVAQSIPIFRQNINNKLPGR